MQRKPSFPVANCSIKMPDCIPTTDSNLCEEDSEQQQKRQQLINFGHSQWGFNNWSWSVTKQDLDFVDFNNGKYCAGVVAFVSIAVKSFDIHRENIGYATSIAPNKGMAIYKSRKCAVTNALRETLLSFGGSVATELNEILENNRGELNNPAQEPPIDNPQSPQRPAEPKNSPVNRNNRKDSGDGNANSAGRSPPIVKNAPVPPPMAKAHPIPANLPPAANRAPLAANAPRIAPVPPHVPPVRPNSNEPSKTAIENMTEEEARAERKRRQRLAQEEFRQKQLQKHKAGNDENQEMNADGSTIDNLLIAMPTQDIIIEDSGHPEVERKRKSPAAENHPAKRRNSFLAKLNIVK
ncbi:hypothetical protein K1T71_010066 [Dendrolimus kikuchii]|uniref:Uncharacterized protein n=1 Tax=Dendrolimus kikuchii TaxID=765133 RepID=A0ACC1CQU0_9NEOP|nr:hypothetical protein K1T71_010066 [Dendrolimus kikuchii]